MIKDLIDRYLILSLSILILTLLIFCSYYVVPLTDESFPIATALRFVQGQRPFIDDFSPYIPLGLLLYPIIKLSLWVHHGNDELILFLRQSYIVFVILATLPTFFLLRKILPQFLAFFIFLSISIFHPFGINNFHYDTLATLMWSNIIFQFFSFQYIDNLGKKDLTLFSFLNLILCFAYPTFVFFLVPFYILYYKAKHINKIILSHILLAAVTSIGLFWIIFAYFKISSGDLHNALNFSQNLFDLSLNEKDITNKLNVVLHSLVHTYLSTLLIACSTLLIAYYFKRFKIVLLSALVFIILLPILKINIRPNAPYYDIFYCINYIGFLSVPLYFLFLKNEKYTHTLIYFVTFPSLAAGFLISLTSYNLALNFAIGFSPAFIVTFIFIFFIINDLLHDKDSALKYILSRVSLLSALSGLAFFHWYYIYGAHYTGMNIYKNSVKINTPGPLNKLRAKVAETLLISDFAKDLQNFDDKNASNKYVYFGIFSAGYLFLQNIKPGEYILFCPYNLSHFGTQVRIPGYIFDFSKFFNLPKENINKYITPQYRKISEKKYYDIYSSSSLTLDT